MAASFVDRGWTHPALSLTHGISTDIFPKLFDSFLADPVFERWCKKGSKWQLHCVGGPGAGKTTLAAVTAQYLRERFQPHEYPVISVYVRQEVITHEAEFLEDFLVILYHGLGRSKVCKADGTGKDYEQYAEACSKKPKGIRSQVRLGLIRKALRGRLQKIKVDACAFLIIDGLDSCGPGLRLLLDAELLALQKHEVHVFVTSRIAIYEHWKVTCDHPDHGREPESDIVSDDSSVEEDETSDGESLIDSSVPLQLYLTCKSCEDLMCLPCFDTRKICKKCQTNDFLHESYDHVNIELHPSVDALREFVVWDLEREHGDLGLGSSAIKPPLSSLGASFQEDYPGSASATVDEIHDQSRGHIGLAKARLDLVHSAQSVEEIRQHRYQLPSNIVSMYDAAIKAIESRGFYHRDLGLEAIAAAGSSPGGLSVSQMLGQLQTLLGANLRSGEEIVDAARGFLVPTKYDQPQIIKAFHITFHYFVADPYNQSIQNASINMLRGGQLSKGYGPSHGTVQPGIRFEPLTTSELPTEVTPSKLTRTVTTMEKVSEEPSHIYILHKGTRAWR